MAVSQPVFLESMPLILSKSLFYTYTKLRPGTTVAQRFDELITKSFPCDYDWVLPEARLMVERLAVTVKFPDPYVKGMAKALTTYLSDIATFCNLRLLQISIGPEYLCRDAGTWEEFISTYTCDAALTASHVGASVGEFSTFWLLDAFLVLRANLPQGCEVRWQFDRAAMPWLPSWVEDRASVVGVLAGFNNTLDQLWKSLE
jgi:hypothetical protein